MILIPFRIFRVSIFYPRGAGMRQQQGLPPRNSSFRVFRADFEAGITDRVPKASPKRPSRKNLIFVVPFTRSDSGRPTRRAFPDFDSRGWRPRIEKPGFAPRPADTVRANPNRLKSATVAEPFDAAQPMSDVEHRQNSERTHRVDGRIKRIWLRIPFGKLANAVSDYRVSDRTQACQMIARLLL